MNEGTVSWKLSNEKMLLREEVAKVFTAIKKCSFEDYAFFAVAANTGLRISEVMHLKTEDVKEAQIVVTRRKKKVLRQEYLDVTEEIAEILRKLVGKKKTGWLWPGESRGCKRPRQKNGKVYEQEVLCQGGHISKRELQRRWARYVEKVRLARPGRGPHALRHYAITEFYRVHRDLRAAQVFAGHSSSAITEVYAHVVDMKEKIQAVKAVL